MASFSAGAIFSFSFTDLLMVNGLMAMALRDSDTTCRHFQAR
jgi:hypothetical protein